jgi:hypothetical protein
VRVQNSRGFTVPGKEVVAGRKPASKTTVEVNGTAVDVSFYGDLPIWDKRAHRYLATPVTFAFVLDKSVVLDTRELVTEELWQYSVDGKVFLYLMRAYPCTIDSKTKQGGCVGADIKLAFYDEKGKGTFETMEIVPANLSTEASRTWQPRIPEWVRRR